MAIVRYGAARAALVAVIAAVLTWVGVPLLVAILIGLVVALPLSLLLFSSLRKDLDNALAVSGARRREQKERLRAQLRGESLEGAEAEADGGEQRPEQHQHAGLAEDRDEVASTDTAEHRSHQ